jgi:N-acetylglucosaminyl-diphospho-decaprenol L-rhamnosyltransferase
MPPTLSIVIVTYNSAAVIGDCLASLPEGWRQNPTDLEIIVVDNGSGDGTPDYVRSRYPEVKLLSGHGNLMFAGGNNYGFRQSAGRFLLMLNPDTVVHPGALQSLAAFAQDHPEAGMVAPRLVNPDGSLQHSTFRFPSLSQAFFGFFERLAPVDSPQNGRYLPGDYERVRPVEHILGAALLIRRELYEAMPGMDEEFGIYFEETDWCYRAHRAGWTLLYTPDAVITHLGAHSTGRDPEKSSAQFYRSQAYFYRKNYGVGLYLLLKALTAVGLSYWLARSVFGWLRGRVHTDKLRLRLWSYGQILKA